MKINIKSFDVEMQLKNKGVEFEVRTTQDEFRGDCIVTKTSLIWCEGKTTRANGKKISWDAFIAWANQQ
jgi:hypothetical protein